MTNALSVVPRVDAVRIVRQGPRVIVIRAGQTVLDVPAEAAMEIGKQLMAAGRLAKLEDPREAERVALDSAVLLRAGVPFGLTSDRRILDMARVEAESNRELRRAMPGGIKGEVQFGTPEVSTPSLVESVRKDLEQIETLSKGDRS